MEEPGKKTATPAPPLPPEAEATDDGPAATPDPSESAGRAPPRQQPDAAAMADPDEEAATPPPLPQEAETTDGPVSASDLALPASESAHRTPPRQQPDAAAAGEQQQKTEADGQPPTPTKAEEVASRPRAPQASSLEMAAAAAPDVDLTFSAPPPAPPAQQQQPGKEATPPPPLEATESTGAHAATPDSAPSPTKPDRRAPPPQELPDATGQPQPTAEATGQPPTPTTAEQLAPLSHPPETPPQESAAPGPAAEAPPPQQPQQQEGSAAEGASSVQDVASAPTTQEGKEKARRLWQCLRTVVRVGFHRLKSAPLSDDKGGDVKPAPDGKQTAAPEIEKKDPAPAPAKKPSRKDSDSGAHAKPVAKKKDEGERSKSRRDEENVPAPAPVKRFQMVGKLVLRIMSLYRRHRSSGKGEAAGAAPGEDEGGKTKPVTAPEEGEGGDTKPVTAPGEGEGVETKPAPGQEEKSPHLKWPREEERLERILEEAFTRLLATEYNKLSCIRQKCLLTFSIFGLAAEVKKQSMIYWWVSEFNLLHRWSDLPTSGKNSVPDSPELNGKAREQGRKTAAPGQGKATNGDKLDREAEGIFSKLSDHGFLEAIKNSCSKVIHGCKVNPLVHWMVKHQARDDRFADLDAKGNPADLQPNSRILCLTAGNRGRLQKMRMQDEPQVGDKSNKPNKEASAPSPQASTEAVGPTKEGTQNIQSSLLDHEPIDVADFKGKRVILNVNAHVYPLSKSLLLHLSDCLVVLQLGRWCNLDTTTYMEVDGLESLGAIGFLKNLRYLGLRGLSRLTKLPRGIQQLKTLTILDMRGCQNLVNVASKAITPLKQLTHLDLTECYMLEYIDRKGITSLSELQVFKGFVFGAGTQGSKACKLRDLKKLKKLQKLTISIATDANVGNREMGELEHLASLRKLTITWSEIPSILVGDTEKVTQKREQLLSKWTSLELPQGLEKLDIRCYPRDKLELIKVPKSLEKLYLRGGDLNKFSIEGPNFVKTLRLRYLKNFTMGWRDVLDILKEIEYVEIVVKDEKVMNLMYMDKKDTNVCQKYIEEQLKLVEQMKIQLVKQMKIPEATLDENGVWVKDKKEEENRDLNADESTSTTKEDAKMGKEAQDAMKKSKVPEPSAPNEVPSTEASPVVNKVTDKPKKTENNHNEASRAQAEGKEGKSPTLEVPEQKKGNQTSVE
uniref:Disease resistance R13L4/SHOC-2-like LRR domain-containing protein n=1 Tax=Arundo donax TaxID=35708 RepID=A0A0A9D5I7_ARUDO